jgi:hypothetical protein
MAHTQPDGHRIGVGAKPGAFYFGGALIYTNSFNQVYGIIYTDNHGQDLQFKNETYFGAIYGDRAEGVCNVVPSNYYYTSSDYAATFDTTKHYPLGYMFEGAEPGELFNFKHDYATGINTLFRSIDSGSTYQVIADTLPNFWCSCSGYVPGQIYGITESLWLYHSSDYGDTFDSLDLDSIIPNAIQSINGVNVYSGGFDGELYLVVFQNDYLYHIYHSTDHGITFTHQSSINVAYYNVLYLNISAGRGPGEFYYIYENLVQPYGTIYTMLEIYYSSDAGLTFTKYVHNLYAEYVGIADIPGKAATIGIHPNPASGHFTAHLPQQPAPSTSLSLTDLTGRQLRQRPLTQQATTLSCEGLPPGVYFVSLVQSGKTLATEKLIVQ